jgi:SAM-dependent methyltransferase
MKLSDLVKLKLELIKYSDVSAVRLAAMETANLMTSVDAIKSYPQIAKVSKHLMSQANKIKSSVDMKINEILLQIDNDIQKQASEYFNESYKRFIVPYENDRSTRTLPYSSEIEQILLGRIRRYVDWHYPGMEIGPHDGQLTQHLVGCDPLYLIDIYPEYLEITKSSFPKEYQERLRTYCIGHQRNEKGLAELPQNQFGFVFSWNVFNYLPLEEIKKYLKDIFNVLRPGGVFMFSFNDGDSHNGAKQVEFGRMAYAPKELLITMTEIFGFELISSYGFEESWHNISWLEIKKPGVLSTIKAHQTLGEIRNIGQ